MASLPESATTSHSDDDTISIVCHLLKSLNTPLAKSLRVALRDDHSMVLSVDYDPSTPTTTELARRNWLVANLVKKAKWLQIGSDESRRQACLDGWLEDEAHNRITNRRLSQSQACTDVSGDSLIFEMRRKIQQLLGSVDLDAVFKDLGFSSGSSTRLPRRQGQPHNKIGGKPHVTAKALPYAIALVRSSPMWTSYCWDYSGVHPRSWFKTVPGGTWFTVDKNARTDRSCEQQPDMNLILQKGIGNFMRNRLKRVGIDLNDQSVNGSLALQASVTNTLATLDLKSASNSVTTGLVRRLFSDEWFDLLDALRCDWVEVDGKWTRLEMFSSMGNGFTFELESLIFWAAASVTCDRLSPSVIDTRMSVYGDDIIVPVAASGALIELLEHLGFRVNEEKSFITGPFRESCGVHAYNGTDITPFYVRDSLSVRHERIRVSNRLRNWGAAGGIADPSTKRTWDRLAKPLQAYRGPASHGDAFLHSESFPLRGKAWMQKNRMKQNCLPDRQESALVAWLMLRAREDENGHAYCIPNYRRLLQAGLYRRVIPGGEPRLTVHQSGSGKITIVRESPLNETDGSPAYAGRTIYHQVARDSTVPRW